MSRPANALTLKAAAAWAAVGGVVAVGVVNLAVLGALFLRLVGV